MKFKEFKKLTFCNSPDIPKEFIIEGKVYEWVGIGIVELRAASAEDFKTLVTIED